MMEEITNAVLWFVDSVSRGIEALLVLVGIWCLLFIWFWCLRRVGGGLAALATWYLGRWNRSTWRRA